MKLLKKILLQEKEVTFQIERAIKCPPRRLKLICNTKAIAMQIQRIQDNKFLQVHSKGQEL